MPQGYNNLSNGVAELVSALTGGGAAVQARARTAEEARMIQAQQERALLAERAAKAVAATNQNSYEAQYLGASPSREDFAAVGGFGADHLATRRAVGVDQQNEARRLAAEMAALAPAGPDRQNALIGVAGDKLLGPGNVQVMPQADANIDKALAAAFASQASGNSSNATAALTNAKIPFVDDQANADIQRALAAANASTASAGYANARTGFVDDLANSAIDLNAAKLANEIAKGNVAKATLDAGNLADKKAVDAQGYQADIVLNKLDEAEKLATGWATGMGADKLAEFGGTDSRNLRATLETIKANLGFDALQAMRAASKTGGALGNITEREIAYLQATISSLDQGQDAETLKKNINQVRYHYRRAQMALQGIDPDSLGDIPKGPAGTSAAAPVSRDIGGKRYTQVNGQWMEE